VTPSVASDGSLRIRVELRDVEPTVWRRLLVPDGITMAELAEILLIAMGWANAHLHLFEVGDKVYGSADDEAEDDEIDESGVIVSDALGRHDRFAFDYDFGDGWEHDVVIEERSSSTVDFAHCLGGENACPPEDVGGPGRYRDFLETIADPEREDHTQCLEWVGGSFDPFQFDADAFNAALRLLGNPELR
jgi:Plasmid pRiA4b ORF-3-like protein